MYTRSWTALRGWDPSPYGRAIQLYSLIRGFNSQHSRGSPTSERSKPPKTFRAELDVKLTDFQTSLKIQIPYTFKLSWLFPGRRCVAFSTIFMIFFGDFIRVLSVCSSLQNKIQFKGTTLVGKDDSHHSAT